MCVCRETFKSSEEIATAGVKPIKRGEGNSQISKSTASRLMDDGVVLLSDSSLRTSQLLYVPVLKV